MAAFHAKLQQLRLLGEQVAIDSHVGLPFVPHRSNATCEPQLGSNA